MSRGLPASAASLARARRTLLRVLPLACASVLWESAPGAGLPAAPGPRAVDGYGDPVQGLRCGLFLEDALGPLRGPVDTLQDLTLDVHLEAQPGQSVRVVVEQENGQGCATPLLFDLELQHRDGTAADLPLWEYNGDSVPPDTAMDWYAELREIAHYSRKLPLLDWYGWQGVILDPGEYRIRAVYRGPPPPQDPARRGSYPDAWRGEVASGWRSFEVQGIAWNGARVPEGEYVRTALHFGPAVDDLHVALDLLPRGGRYLSGESVRPLFYVENTGSRELYVDRDTSDQRDQFRGRSLAGVPLGRGSSFHRSGSSPITRWWLPPGQIVKLPYPLTIRLHCHENGSLCRTGLCGPAGRYALSFEVAVTTQFTAFDHGARRFPGWYLSTGETEIELLHRAPRGR